MASSTLSRQPLPALAQRHLTPGAQAFIHLLADINRQIVYGDGEALDEPEDTNLVYDRDRMTLLIGASMEAALHCEYVAFTRECLWSVAELLAGAVDGNSPVLERPGSRLPRPTRGVSQATA